MKLIILDSNKKEVLTHGPSINLNLNCLIKQSMDYEDIKLRLVGYKNMIESTKSINLCNLSSLCYRLQIKYGNEECLDLVRNIVKVLKDINPNIILTQAGVDNYGEIDLKPFSYLYKIEENIVYVIKPIRDILRLMGYVEGQLLDLVRIKNFENYLPSDLLEFISVENNESLNSYIKIKEVLWSMVT